MIIKGFLSFVKKNLKEVPRSFDEIKEYLEKTPIEGIVFWKDGEPKCKIKRSDFGLEWSIEGAFY